MWQMPLIIIHVYIGAYLCTYVYIYIHIFAYLYCICRFYYSIEVCTCCDVFEGSGRRTLAKPMALVNQIKLGTGPRSRFRRDMDSNIWFVPNHSVDVYIPTGIPIIFPVRLDLQVLYPKSPSL